MTGGNAYLRAFDLAVAVLLETRARFAVIGGLAVSVRTEPRFTKDADFLVAVAGDAEAERIGQAMLRHGFVLVSLFERTDLTRIATMRFTLGDVYVDLLPGVCGAEAEMVADAADLEVIEGRRCAVASVGALIGLKALACANRKKPDDHADLQRLLAVATEADMQSAVAFMALMEARQAPGSVRLRAVLAAAQAYATSTDG